MVEEQESPRIIKTHLAFEMLPQQVPENREYPFLVGDGEATKSDLRDEESKGCSCVLFQPLAGNLSNHKYVLHDQIVQRSRLWNKEDECKNSEIIWPGDFNQVMAGFTGTLSNLVDAFIAGTARDHSWKKTRLLFIDHSIGGVAGYYSPFLSHVLSYWNQRQAFPLMPGFSFLFWWCWNPRQEDHLLFLTYEEMKTDLAGVVNRVAIFLGKTLTPKQVITWQWYDDDKDEYDDGHQGCHLTRVSI